MINNPFETSLAFVEAQVLQVVQILAEPCSDELTRSCQRLQREVGQLSKVMSQLPVIATPTLQQQRRVQKISAALTTIRECLARQAVLTQHALATLVPASQSTTYAPVLSGQRSYGSAGRQSGEFKAFLA